MTYKIDKGDIFKCIKTFKMEDGEVAYTKGKIYVSEVKNCITDNQYDVDHEMSNCNELFDHFKLELVK